MLFFAVQHPKLLSIRKIAHDIKAKEAKDFGNIDRSSDRTGNTLIKIVDVLNNSWFVSREGFEIVNALLSSSFDPGNLTFDAESQIPDPSSLFVLGFVADCVHRDFGSNAVIPGALDAFGVIA